MDGNPIIEGTRNTWRIWAEVFFLIIRKMVQLEKASMVGEEYPVNLDKENNIKFIGKHGWIQ